MKKTGTYLIVISLIVVVCIAFGRIAFNNFINFDDDGYITKNYQIQSGLNFENVKWAFTAVVLSNWHPLTLLSHMLDWSLFGNYAGGHHLVSLLWHIGTVILLFLFLYKTTHNIWPSAFAAAFFALHPLRVESVAWASERKDVLSLFFGMSSIYAYAFYVEKNKISRYLLCLMFFIMSLMSKPMLVTLPFMLLLLDYWPLNRWQQTLDTSTENSLKPGGKLLLEKTPFVLISIASSIITLWAQNKGGSIVSEVGLPLTIRLSNAIFAYTAYLGKILWPVDLAVFYPLNFYLPLWQVIISGITILTISLAVLYFIKKMPFLFVGWFWYLGTLIPVIGVIQVGGQAVADRYTYLPFIGIAVILAWGIPLVFQRLNISKGVLVSLAIATLSMLAFLTWIQCIYWKDSITLFSHTLRVTKDNYLAHNNLGAVLSERGKIKEAVHHYNTSIRINPNYNFSYINRGNLYNDLGQHYRAILDYNQAIRLKPDYVIAYYNRGIAYFNRGQYQQAIDDYNEVLRLQPDNAAAYNNRGNAYLHQGNKNKGCNDAQKACLLGSCHALKLGKSKGYCD